MIKRNNEIVSLNKYETKLQLRIDTHICVVLVPENHQNPTKQLTKTLTKIKLSEGELKKV